MSDFVFKLYKQNVLMFTIVLGTYLIALWLIVSLPNSLSIQPLWQRVCRGWVDISVEFPSHKCHLHCHCCQQWRHEIRTSRENYYDSGIWWVVILMIVDWEFSCLQWCLLFTLLDDLTALLYNTLYSQTEHICSLV